ncbi:MAG: VWA domain-containing protein, partial [Rhodospirillales bacterium]|nr:VWA domain-containing protein [Rhodospirillales bacterium]
LAIRTLVVLALFLAVARPVISASGIGAWISGSNRVSRVIIIDDSLSMDYRTGGVSAMQRARDVATALVNKLGAKDSVTVVRTSNPDEPLVRQASLEDPALLLAEVAGLEATSTGSNWAQSLSAARNYLDELPFPIQEITLITDLRQHGWSEQVTELSDELAEQGVDLRIIDVGRESTGNAALISLSMRQPIALAGGDTQLIAEIRNDGEQSLSEPQARLTVDDRTTTITLPDIEPGKSVQVPLAARFSEPGPHAVSLTLDDDAMPADNTGHLAVDVRRTLEVQLVDGQLQHGLAPLVKGGHAQWHLVGLAQQQLRTVSLKLSAGIRRVLIFCICPLLPLEHNALLLHQRLLALGLDQSH